MTSLLPLNGLRAFEAAARTGSFVAAAAELHVSPSAISRLVKLLEQRLDVGLFDRLANGLVLTEPGRVYLAELSLAFERIAQATDRVTAASSRALLIGAGPTLAMRWLIPRLTGFHKLHPGIDIQLSTAIAEADPMRPDWTAALRAGDGVWPGYTSHFLFTADLFPVCTPAMARALRSPSDLAKATILQVTNDPDDWRLWLHAAMVELDLSHARQFDYPAFALQAALDGMGVAMARAPFVVDDLAARRLVRPFTLSVPRGKGWYLVYRPAQECSVALKAFRAWLLDVVRVA